MSKTINTLNRIQDAKGTDVREQDARGQFRGTKNGSHEDLSPSVSNKKGQPLLIIFTIFIILL